MPQALTSLEEAIRHSVATDSFTSAQNLLGGYVAEVERQLRNLAPGSEDVRALERRTRRLFEWVGAMALAARAYAAAELSRLQLLARYGTSAGPRHCIRTQA